MYSRLCSRLRFRLCSMKVLVIGGGGREHAIVRACAEHGHEIICTPANPGIAQHARVVSCAQDPKSLADLAQQETVDIVIVGPEAYLNAGLSDECQRRGIAVFGPSQKATQLEADKAWSKAFMQRHNIPTAQHQSFDTLDAAQTHISSLVAASPKLETPIVIKDAALKAGKGVTIAHTVEEAQHALEDIFAADGAEDGAKGSVVIEEFMTGQEVSILALTDGENYALTLPSQDYKTIHEGDTGPMTGGMGVICPFPLTEGQLQVIHQDIIQRTLAGMKAEGNPFVGVLYAGLMLTPTGPKVVEFNARFGDPEAQAVLTLLTSDLAQHALDAAKGELDPKSVQFSGQSSAVVVLAAPGYPSTPQKDIPLRLPHCQTGELIYHAGTREQDGQLLSSGGRVLAVTVVSDSLPEALKRAYTLVAQVKFDGVQMRRDIGYRLGLDQQE